MKLYQVADRLIELGPGAVFSLDAEQMRRRGHRVRVIDQIKVAVADGAASVRSVVSGSETLQFKRGEVVGLPGDKLEERLVGRMAEMAAPPLPESKAVKDAAKAASSGRNDRQVAIQNAIGQLNPRSRRDFTSAGVPAVKAIEKILGYDISAPERDRAWQAMSER